MPRWLYGRGSRRRAALRGAARGAQGAPAKGEKVFEELLSGWWWTTSTWPPWSSRRHALGGAEGGGGGTSPAKAAMSAARWRGDPETKALKEAPARIAGALASIPRVTTADLERSIKTYRPSRRPRGRRQAAHAQLPTAASSADVLLDLTRCRSGPAVARFLTNIIDEVGTSDWRRAAAARIGARTGGVGTAMLYEQLTGEGGTSATRWRVATLRCAARRRGEGGGLFDLTHRCSPTPTCRRADKAVELLKETKTRSSRPSSPRATVCGHAPRRAQLAARVHRRDDAGRQYYKRQGAQRPKDDWPTLAR